MEMPKTKEQLLNDVRALEERAFEIMDDELMADEFNAIIGKAKHLQDFAKKEGWI